MRFLILYGFLSVIYAVGQQGWISLCKKNMNEYHFHTMDVPYFFVF